MFYWNHILFQQGDSNEDEHVGNDGEEEYGGAISI